MKKSITIILLSLLVFSSIVLAEENSLEKETNDTRLDLNETLRESQDKIKELASKEKLEELKNFEDEIVLPEILQKITRILFGIEKEREISLQLFIVLLAVFIIITVMITGTIYLTPLHMKPLELFIFKLNPDYLIGLIVTSIVSFTGVLDLVVSDWFFSLKVYNQLLEKLGSWNIFLMILLFIIIFFILRYASKKIRRKVILDSASYSGQNIKVLKDTAQINSESLEKLTDDS